MPMVKNSLERITTPLPWNSPLWHGTVIVQNNRKNALFLLSRSFKTKVAHLKNRAFHAIYGENTGRQESGKTYANDVKLTAWTMQYSIAPYQRLSQRWFDVP